MARALRVAVATLAFIVGSLGCGSSKSSSSSLGDDEDAGEVVDGSISSGVDAAGDGGSTSMEGGPSPGRFVTAVVSFAPTDCAGFGAAAMPGVVEGPPVGGGSDRGSTDVVSLGSGGTIVVSFLPNAIVDGPGPDFIVFENPFWIGGNSSDIYAEPGEVSVSDDGTTWQTFACNPTIDPSAPIGTGTEPPYGSCAGWHVVYSTPTNGVSPFDPATAGGDAFDLADLAMTRARYLRIVDRTAESCPEAGADKPTTNGFDLDAVAVIHAEQP